MQGVGRASRAAGWSVYLGLSLIEEEKLKRCP